MSPHRSGPAPAIPRGLWRRPTAFLALGLGAGFSPYAPGTAGTVVGVAVYLVLAPLAPGPRVAAVALLFVLGIGLCARAARILGVHDHPAIVWDEIVGFLVTMLPAPGGWPWIGAGFVLFRLFDIFKPWPIRWLDRNVPGGLGIMIDDLAAGICAGAVLWVLARFVFA
ncbi:phosphatidylglycerophosphatase A [bacterium BMS3Abin12]|nr:phosphatidylglycerophosphatase A [bacterium BMS3Abin12]